MIIYYNVVRNKILKEILINKNINYKLAKYANHIELWWKQEQELSEKCRATK